MAKLTPLPPGAEAPASEWYEGCYPKAPSIIEVKCGGSGVGRGIVAFKVEAPAADEQGKRADPLRHDFPAVFEASYLCAKDPDDEDLLVDEFDSDDPPRLHFCNRGVEVDDCDGLSGPRERSNNVN